MALAVFAKDGCANFVSDNTAGCAPEVQEAVLAAGKGAAPAYGNDNSTKEMHKLFSETFETSFEDIAVFPVATGTAANSLALASVCLPYSAIFCFSGAHVVACEACAPEFYTSGAKLVGVESNGKGELEGKINVEGLKAAWERTTMFGFEGGKPACLSLTQVNEAGQVYTLEEIKALTKFAKSKGMVVHMDGARFGNAVAALGCFPADMTWRAGVDILSFGGTKGGCMAAEAVVVFGKRARDKAYLQHMQLLSKRGGHIWSKMRFLSSQLVGFLKNGVWLRYAASANRLATLLADGVERIAKENKNESKDLQLLKHVAANEVFIKIPSEVLRAIESDGHACLDIGLLGGHMGKGDLVRCVTAWSTTKADVENFLSSLEAHMTG
eukprot:m.3812 g.3812  ORF g.3812 m.3812 type:complete len:383 (+) comp2834_c0_seq2:327-1475(+)